MEILKSHLTINVSDIEVSVAFYRSIGFKLDQMWEDHYAQLSAPGIEIGLHPSSIAHGAEHRQALSIGFTSSDFDGVTAELAQLGISFAERTENGGHFVHFQDPDGTPPLLYQTEVVRQVAFTAEGAGLTQFPLM